LYPFCLNPDKFLNFSALITNRLTDLTSLKLSINPLFTTNATRIYLKIVLNLQTCCGFTI
jgi:hypothetical protein